MAWLAVRDSRMHEPQPALSPREVADGPQGDIACDSDRRINKDNHFIQKGRKLFSEKTAAREQAVMLAAFCRKSPCRFFPKKSMVLGERA